MSGITTENNFFSQALHSWYRANGRDLPWRSTNDPYAIWISEIILQQTRVEQGLDYYLRFMQRFPDANTLADADEIDILKLWQGLGYYSRARNLHFAAKQIKNDFGGTFPSTYQEVRSLKGIGDYTAAAVCSFAYGQPYAVLDGNVYRVLARFFGIHTPIDTAKAKKEFSELAQHLLDKKNPSLYNQSIMDFGALQCTPASPRCDSCPLAEKCAALSQNEQSVLPLKSKKTISRKRYFNYFYIVNGGKTYLHKRTGNDIWKNLYEFPLIETDEETPLQDLVSMGFLHEIDINACRITEKMSLKHILTHQTIFAKFYIIDFCEQHTKNISNFIEIKESDIDSYPIARLSEIFLEQKDTNRK